MKCIASVFRYYFYSLCTLTNISNYPLLSYNQTTTLCTLNWIDKKKITKVCNVPFVEVCVPYTTYTLTAEEEKGRRKEKREEINAK